MSINMLPDNVLLDIFDFYQRRRYYRGSHEWQRLVHVCQRWRHIVFASPLRLDLTLLCTYGTPVKKNLGCWPPLPIFVDYITWNGTGRAPDYEVDVTAALEHIDRIRSIKLALTAGSVLDIIASVMLETFPVLTELWLISKDRNAPVLLDTFLGGSAPSLQCIYLWGISFPSLPTLLLSTSDLFYLRLEDIPQGGYISPQAMVRGLAALSRLESLWISFKSPTPRFEPLYLPFFTRSVLPSLISFNYRGSSGYLEHLLARINSPRLHFFEISYFNELDFQVPQLSQFIDRTENLELAQSRHAHVRFHIDSICIELDCEEEGHRRCRLILRISCKWLDWQVSCLAKILGQSPAMVSSVDHLSIDGVNLHLEPGRQEDEDLDGIDWLELLRPFTAVKTLHGSKQLAGYIALALGGVSRGIVIEELPILDTLSLEDQSARSVEQFITVRRLSGHQITFADPAPLPATDVLVDGYIARTFATEDATNYFMCLLKTPSPQSFLRYHGVVYVQDAWYITYNVDLVQATSPGALLQTSFLLDHSIRETYGTVVPQRRWVPTYEVDVRRYVDDYVLQLPIFFVNHNNSIGFRLPDILRGCDGNLHKANSFAPLGGKTTTHIRINWPGYGYWKRQIPTRDETHEHNPITVARFMKHVGSSVDIFFRGCMSSGCVATDPRWQIGMHGGITQEQVKIIGAVHVTAGSWMPIIQLTHM